MTMYDVRECPICLALVFGKRGQAGHQHYHDEQESGGEVVVLAHEEEEPEFRDPYGRRERGTQRD
jgi:hypothetical protein